MQCFSYKKVAREAGIPPDALADLCTSVREEFPTDGMMHELRVLRACMPVRDGYAKLEHILPHEAVAVASR
ncbi:MAG: hypothetical protein FJ290_25950 [Planctomycetes bacterium]|nr:hypothetical protein [Planctomycetota bacterium]